MHGPTRGECSRFRSRQVGFAFTAGLLVLLAVGGHPALAGDKEPLTFPYEISTPQGSNILETTLKVKMGSTSYDYWEKFNLEDGTKCFKSTPRNVDLRMYGYENPKSGPHACGGNSYCYGFPGPTYRMRRADDSYPGDIYHLTLTNELAVGDHHMCNIAGHPYD